MTILSLDVESRSTVDLKKTGAYPYWAHEDTALWCACYAFDDEPVQTWLPGQPCPPRVAQHVESGGTISAWNATFERLAWNHALGPRHGWPVPRLEQYEDTAAYAAALSLPRALGMAAKALGVAEQKDDDGARLMMQMAKPRKPRKDEAPDAVLWWDDEDRIGRLVAYCVKDVEAERAIRKILVPLSDAEKAVYHLDQRINDRGVRIDLDLVRAMLGIAGAAREHLDAQLEIASGFKLTKCSEVAKMVVWLHERGVQTDSLDKNALARLLSYNDLPKDVRAVLELRKEYAKSSTAKLEAMAHYASVDGRARGLHLYHGASTGRWAGRGIQSQNMPRGTGTVKDPETAAPDFLHGSVKWIDMLHGTPMSAVSDMLRACITASKGHRLVVADFASIEGRVTAWLAGETWKVEAFVLNDEGRGPGMYELAASGIYGLPVAEIGKKSMERQVGKAAELGLGFGGGVMAFDAMAKVYGVDMAGAYAPLSRNADPEVWDRALESYERWSEEGLLGTAVLGREAWIASEVTKVQWRNKHPATVALWAGLEAAAMAAVENPSEVHAYGRIAYLVRRGFLWCRLPSGRCLAYADPQIRSRKAPWGDESPCVTAMGMDSVTNKWRRQDLYGGLLTENCVQAIARDLLAHGMQVAEGRGYPIVLHIHDEAVADVPLGRGSLAEFEASLAALPDWADGLPVVAEGYEAFRYRKD